MSFFTRHRRGTLRGVLVAAVASAALVLTACSGGTGNAGPSAPVELTDSGKDIEHVTVAFPGSLANLYIGQEAGILNYYLAATVQEGLTGIDASGELVPALATEWTVSDDGTTYVFQLREDAKFQNGDPVTAEDVVFSLEQAANEATSPNTAWYLMLLESVEQTGEHEVTVKTSAPDATFLVNLSNVGALNVTQKSFWEEHDGNVGTSQSLLMGTGPYQVTEFSPNSHVTLERVDTWWGDLPKVEEIRVDFIPDENTRLLAAQKGDIDVAFNVPLKQSESWQKISDGRVEGVNDLSYLGLMFDQSVAPFDDPDVRAAVASAVDREAVVDKLLRGYGEVATAIMTPESLRDAFSPEEARERLSELPQHDFDLDAAQKLLDGSAGAGGFTTELIYPNTGPQIGTAAQSLAENLSKIGITLKVREVPLEEWLATIGDGEHGIGFMWYFSTTGDPAEVNSYMLGLENPNHFESEEAADLVAKSLAEGDPTKRAELLLELEELNATQTVNAPLWWGQSLTYFDNNIGVHEFTPYTFLGSWGSQLFAAE